MWHHSMSCEYPEGCSCGATEWNNLEKERDELRAQALKNSPAQVKVGKFILSRLNGQLFISDDKRGTSPCEKHLEEKLESLLAKVLENRWHPEL